MDSNDETVPSRPRIGAASHVLDSFRSSAHAPAPVQSLVRESISLLSSPQENLSRREACRSDVRVACQQGSKSGYPADRLEEFQAGFRFRDAMSPG